MSNPTGNAIRAAAESDEQWVKDFAIQRKDFYGDGAVAKIQSIGKPRMFYVTISNWIVSPSPFATEAGAWADARLRLEPKPDAAGEGLEKDHWNALTDKWKSDVAGKGAEEQFIREACVRAHIGFPSKLYSPLTEALVHHALSAPRNSTLEDAATGLHDRLVAIEHDAGVAISEIEDNDAGTAKRTLYGIAELARDADAALARFRALGR